MKSLAAHPHNFARDNSDNRGRCVCGRSLDYRMHGPAPLCRLPLLAAGTRVQRLTGGYLGTVQPYREEDSIRLFPVRWDDILQDGSGAVWETCDFTDVLVIRRAARKTTAA